MRNKDLYAVIGLIITIITLYFTIRPKKKIMDGKITTNFSWYELTKGEPISEKVQTNLMNLVTNLLQPVRDLLREPIIVTSGYRSLNYNRKIGGASGSQHVVGEACDIIIHKFTPSEMLELFGEIMQTGLIFDQLIYEQKEGATWIHMSLRSDRNRNQAMTANYSEEQDKMVFKHV